MVLYLDESGDLGFGPRSSQTFVILFLATENEIDLKRRVRWVRRRAGIPPKVEIKASASSPELREAMLTGIAQAEVGICSISVNKARVHDRLRSDTNILYNYAAGLLLIPYLKDLALERLTIVVDQRITRVAKGLRLDDYLKTELWGRHGVYTDLLIHHLDSREVLALQAADFVANALFRGRERGEWRWWNLVRARAQQTRKLFYAEEGD